MIRENTSSKYKNPLLTAIIVFIFTFTLVPMNAKAKINFSAVTEDRIEIDKLEVSKEDFLNFVKEYINSLPKGLGNYGTVSFKSCDYKINNLKLSEYKTPDGKEIRFFSNPSCDEILIRKVLESSYDFEDNSLSRYENRTCVLATKRIFSPILEYYSLKFEERDSENCQSCDFKERNRLNRILTIQKDIQRSCKSATDNVVEFVSDFDVLAEETYRTKNQ